MQSVTRNLGLTGLALVLLSCPGCVHWQTKNVPDYSSEFIDCVADGVEASQYNDCIEQALIDWFILVE